MKKSVLFIVQNLPVPQDRRIWMEAKTLKQNGFLVSIISPGNPEQKKFEQLEDIFVYRYVKPAKAKGYLSYLWEYAYSFSATCYLTFKIYFRQGFAVIHTANPPDIFFVLGLIFKLAGVKFVYDQHDLVPEMSLCKFQKNKNSYLYRLLLLLECLSYVVADVHISTCESGQEVVLSRVNSHQRRASALEKNFIVRSAPSLEVINPKLADKERINALRKKYPYVACYLGVMGPQDGVDKLLRSIRFIVRDLKRTDIGFVLMGDGDDLERLKKLSVEYGIAQQVIFTGWADKNIISTYFWASDLGLMPEPKNDYTDNSLHNKILEYMAAGLPVVAYDLKEAKKSAGKAALFIPYNNEREFAKAICGLIDNPEHRKNMRDIALARFNHNFRPEFPQKELLVAYNSLYPTPIPINNLCNIKS